MTRYNPMIIGGPLPIETASAWPPRPLNFDLGPGDEIAPILAILEQLARQYSQTALVRQAAEAIVSQPGRLRNHDQGQQIRRLAEWVKNQVVYVKDPAGLEYVKSPLLMLDEIAQAGQTLGDCDDHVLLFASLARSLGLDCRILGVSLSGGRIDHVIASVRPDGGAWQDLDLCAKQIPAPEYLEKVIA